jgi:exodeoxyribonuclease V gamma subunit
MASKRGILKALGIFVLGFLAGGITFCSLLPMRSIPASVICLLGMNDGAFPRQSPPPSFDL